MWVAASGLLPFSVALFFALFLLLMAALLPRCRRSSLVVFLLVASVGACRFLVSAPAIRMHATGWLEQALPADGATVAGTVADFPKYYPYERGGRGTWVIPLELEAACLSNAWKTCRGAIAVRRTGASAEPPVQFGQRLACTGSLEKPLYPGREAMVLQQTAADPIKELSAAPRFSPLAFAQAWRRSAAENLGRGIERLPEQQSVLKALVLGYRSDIPPETMARFRRTGSVHVFAISGLHVGMVGLLLGLVLKSVGIPRDWVGVWLVPLLLVYVMSTGMKPSALRALAMAAVFLLAPLFRRKPDIPSSVAFAAILLLLLRPMELMSAGFVFSFTVVVFIVAVFAKVPQPWLQGGAAKTYTVSLGVTSFAAGLASMPLAALYFGTWSPVAFAGNLVVVPLTFCIVLSGWLSVLIPVASPVFNHAAVVFINLLLTSVEWLDRIPGSCWQVDPPPLLAVAVWYASLLYLFTHAAKRNQCAAALGGALFAVLLAVLG